MAADSPTPGTETHRMLAGSHERPGGAECRCGAPWDRWNDRCARPAAPSPVDTTEPPAETQQDDELPRWIAVAPHSEECPAYYDESECSPSCHRDELRQAWEQALTARPSADTETLRRVRELADEWRSEGRHGADAIALYAALDAR